MTIENPEVRAKILEWQKQYQIEDGDPALALLELMNIFQPTGTSVTSVDPASAEQISESLKTSLLPAIERLVF